MGKRISLVDCPGYTGGAEEEAWKSFEPFFETALEGRHIEDVPLEDIHKALNNISEFMEPLFGRPFADGDRLVLVVGVYQWFLNSYSTKSEALTYDDIYNYRAYGEEVALRLEAALIMYMREMRLSSRMEMYFANYKVLSSVLRSYLSIGERLYRVGSVLATCFINTNISAYPSEHLRLPYPTVSFELPYVLSERPAYVYAAEYHADGGRWWRLLVIFADHEGTHQGGQFLQFKLPLHDGTTLKDALRIMEDSSLREHGSNPDLFQAAISLEEAVELNVAAFKYLASAVIYATQPDTMINYKTINENPEYTALRERALNAPKGSKERKRLLDRAKPLRGKDITLLTGDIIVDKFKKDLKKAAAAGEGVQGWKLNKRCFVSGHWHKYWIGAGRSSLVHKFVQPYWKGPMIGASGRTTHRLK